jgi:hypothetical protein
LSKYVGRRVSAQIAKETSRGAGPAGNTTYGLPFSSFSFDDKIDEAVVESAIGQIASPLQRHVIGEYAEGDFEGEVRDQSFGLLLLALYGSVSPSGPTDSAYTHTFTVDNTAQHDSLALKVGDPNQTILFKLAMLNSLTVNYTLDEVVNFSANFMSKRSATSSGTITYTAENKFHRKYMSARVAAVTGDLAAASDLSVKSITLNFNKNLMRDNVLRTASPEDILNQTMTIDGEIVLNYEDQTWKNYMLNATTRALRVRVTNTDATIGAGSTNPYLDFQFDAVDFFDWEPDRGLDDIVTQTVSFRANYDLTNSSQSQAVLVNSVVSY